MTEYSRLRSASKPCCCSSPYLPPPKTPSLCLALARASTPSRCLLQSGRQLSLGQLALGQARGDPQLADPLVIRGILGGVQGALIRRTLGREGFQLGNGESRLIGQRGHNKGLQGTQACMHASLETKS